jgi:gas vesicle protein GvpL/GvpF
MAPPHQAKPNKAKPRRAQPDKAQPTRAEHGCYVYGIVDADVEVEPGTNGVGDPPTEVELIRSGRIAALVSDIDLDHPLGTPEDLMAHKDLLDTTATEAPVLPFRFGAVLASPDAVVEELMEPHQDEFADALRELEGEAQYVVRARYAEEAILREVLAENPKAAKLRERIGPDPDESTKGLQIQLGELINSAIEAKRDGDTKTVVEALQPVAVATTIRPPTHDLDAAHVAILERVERHSDVEDALSALARNWNGRATVRLLGPMAPYDFVVTTQ